MIFENFYIAFHDPIWVVVLTTALFFPVRQLIWVLYVRKKQKAQTIVSDDEKKVLKKYKVWAKKKFMGREFLGIVRTTFLIDKKGKILKIWNNVKVNGHAQEVLETLENISKK